MLWTKKYQPKKLSELQGNEDTVTKLRELILKKKPALLHGTVGCGKTSSVYALADELDYDIIEINASDFRNKQHINDVIKNSLEQQSLFNRGKLV
mgnify:FL=1